jgi:pheromone shutdown protein TraB
VATDPDPRLSGEHVRTLAGAGGTVTLVGVVHDHPASVYRVRRVVTACDPDALALELPPLSVPLFETYADDDRSPPAFGGEMSAAVQAADTDRVVGIDGPTPGFLVRLARTLVRARASLGTVRRVLDGLRSVTHTAMVCRGASVLAGLTDVRLEVASPTTYDCERTDDPGAQAADERAQISRARAVLDAFEPSRAARFRDDTREAHMADRLAGLDGDVVAVLGHDHLDPVAERLRADE